MKQEKNGTTETEGVISSLDKNFGNGGVGYIKDEQGTEYFFHSRFVVGSGYSKLQIGMQVKFQPIKAKRAMGAGPQARKVTIKGT
ncbi:hypothetical protein VCSRO25_0292 [Vibrio cholerae]|nr:hypothetical protein [Vibrio cholerae]GHY61886.1 hypothetical protein VCSRO25_0292 [Vibrio cholerae]GHZ11009.1 hypothetical protein VCSRO171_2278 [Vibrio cholerae]HCJ7260356.1 cold shock domain-containing protein [Vibrio cholerae]HCJ7289622.1 cold shock domain-containing protein [Vibrio cholerae]